MRTLAALPLLMLAACSEAPDTPTPTPSASITPDKPRTLIPLDLALLKLGGTIGGSEADGEFASDGHVLAAVTSHVVCPEGVAECTPETLPADTVYTYVHRVTPGKGIANATLFRTARPAEGFAHGVGYDEAEAAAALGPDGQIDVAADNGALVWRVIGGDGWKAGEPITFYWQSTLPPAGTPDAYLVEADGSVAIGSSPFPPKEKPVEEAAGR